MTDRIEIQGKTVEAAVSEALLQMGARRDEVEIKVLEEPKSGFMGILGGRAARVLVRKKRSRRRGGGKDHRVDEEGYQAHNLSGGRSRGKRGGSRRKSSGGSGRSDGQGEAPREAREGRDGQQEKSNGGRRGSRGRGGRGRSQEAGGRKQEQAQGRNQRQGQKQKPAQRSDQKAARKPDQKPTQKSDQKQDRRPQPAKAEKQEASRGRAGANGRRRNERGRRRPESPPESRSESPREVRAETRSEARPEAREEIRPPAPPTARVGDREQGRAEKPTESRSRRREAPAPVPEPAAPAASPEPKEETKVSKPSKPRRAFGGLGARLKERKAAAKAAAEAAAAPESPAPPTAPPTTPPTTPVTEAPATEAPATEAPRAVETPREVRRDPDPAPPARSERYAAARSPRFGSDSRDEVILDDIKAAEYAKPVGKVDDAALDDTLTELTDGMLARAGFPCRCETHPGEYRQIKVTTDDASAGMLIGRHGQTVDAVEHLVERMASNAIDARARINLDINNYRQRREEALVERVAEAAEQIRETGRAFHMEPMSARERRIVHMETANLGGLRTFTMDGSGGKHVVIAADEERDSSAGEDDVQPDDVGHPEDEQKNF